MFYRFLYGYIVIYNYEFIITILFCVYDIPFRKHRFNKFAYESISAPSFQQAVLQFLQGLAGNSCHLF